VRNVFQAFAALVLFVVTESIVRLKVLKFSAAAFIALTVSWLLIRSALTTLSVISFDRFTNSSVYCGVLVGKFTIGFNANLGANAPNYSFPLTIVFGIEALASALLMALIFMVVYTKGLKGFGGIAIAGIVGLDIFF
jgi:hypothetical protein